MSRSLSGFSSREVLPPLLMHRMEVELAAFCIWTRRSCPSDEYADKREQDAEDAERERVEGPPGMGNGMESVMA